MAYIGNSPANTGNYQIVDSISSSFNGSTTSFALTSGALSISPAKSGQLLVNINGVMQQPDDVGSHGFKASGSNIIFSSAPASGDTFWAVYQGQNVDIGTPSDNVVDTAHIKDNAITADKIAAGAVVADIATGGITTAKIADDAVTADKLANAINAAITANTAKITYPASASNKLATIEASADVTDTTNVVAALSAGTGVGITGAGVVSVTAVALTTVQTAANQTAHLALTAQEGDVVVRADENKSYVHNGGSAGNMNDYTLLATPTDSVLSVNGATGAVTAAQIATAVEAASDSNTFTDDDHTKLNAIEPSATADQTAAQIKTHLEDGIDSVHYVDGSIDHIHLAGDIIDGDNIGDDVINSEHVAAGAIDLEHMSSESVDEDNLYISNAGSNGQFLSKQSGNNGGLTWAAVDALPSQSSNSGKFLTTNGSAASWAVLDTDANSTTKGLYEMANVISANYVIGNNNNAMSAGPITINSNISVTIPSGSTWVIA